MVLDRRALPRRVMKTSSKIYERREETVSYASGRPVKNRERIQNRDK